MSLSIGNMAKYASCSVPTVRYYEQIGLLGSVARAINGRRTYGWPDVSRLRFIRRARGLGMSIDEVRELLEAMNEGVNACAPARSIVAARLEEITLKRAELEALERSLTVMLARCAATCIESVPCCTIFDDIEPDAAKSWPKPVRSGR